MLKAEIIGHIGADAEVREFGGKRHVTFRVAHSERRRDEAGEREEVTTWISVLWYGEGRGLLPYLRRGAQVFVRGNLRVKLYTDKSGCVQYALNLHATEVQLCGVKGENTANPGQVSGTMAPQAQSTMPASDGLPF